MKKKIKKHSMVGMFFYSLGADGKLQWQGYIKAEPKKNLYLVQFFDWLMGEPPHDQKLIHLDEMKTWLFYNSAESMRFSAEYGTAYHLRHKNEDKNIEKTSLES